MDKIEHGKFKIAFSPKDGEILIKAESSTDYPISLELEVKDLAANKSVIDRRKIQLPWIDPFGKIERLYRPSFHGKEHAHDSRVVQIKLKKKSNEGKWELEETIEVDQSMKGRFPFGCLIALVLIVIFAVLYFIF